MKTKVLRGCEMGQIVDRIVQEALRSAQEERWIGIVLPALTGERISRCDEGVVFESDPYVGIVTIAPDGLGATVGRPTIVGMHIRPLERGKGYGTALLESAVRRCTERGFSRIHIDAMSPAMVRCTRKLSYEMQDQLEVIDWSSTIF